MNITKVFVIVPTLFKMEINKAREFKSNTFFEVVTSISYLVINVFFWSLMFNLGYNLDGWNRADIIIFIAFSELFFGLHASLITSLSRFWQYILSGKLDTILVRPIDAKVRILLVNINYIEFIKTIVFFVFMLIYSGKNIDFLRLMFAVMITISSIYIFAQIQLILSYIAFGFGKMEALNELSDSLTMLNKYPISIFPRLFIIIGRWILPFLFFSTFPAQIVNQSLTVQATLLGLFGLITNIVFWTLIHRYSWKRGLKSYESYNG